jgi:tetratricopeptide (TPR) repeat protein
VPEVYVEGLRGSLQAELLADTRRHGLIPYVLAPNADALLAEIGAGRPVLVLQNLGLPRVPVWHYAVAVGYDAERDTMVLRSGPERRRLEKSRRFLRSWQRGADWAFVAVAPGSLPATAVPDAYVRAVADAERLLPPRSAHEAFAAALGRWPRDELVLFAAANHELRARATPEAIALYRKLLEIDPRHAAARNNLANALADQGCYPQALAEARAARAAAAAGDPLAASIDDTVATLERAAATAPAATCP